jgi:hypothetical protein
MKPKHSPFERIVHIDCKSIRAIFDPDYGRGTIHGNDGPLNIGAALICDGKKHFVVQVEPSPDSPEYLVNFRTQPDPQNTEVSG